MRKITSGVAAVIFALAVTAAGAPVARVSVDSAGVQASGQQSAISRNGRFVVFSSSATNLVASDTNGKIDIFVHDRDPDGNTIFDEGNGITRRVSVSSAGDEANGDCTFPAISSSGRFVVFQSTATNLVPNDTNNKSDVFLHDRDPDNNGIFDEGNGVTTRISVASDGTQADDASFPAKLSDDGRYAIFVSAATNLVPNDTNGFQDAFIRDTQTNQTTRISVATDGSQGNGAVGSVAISGNGLVAAFISNATNMLASNADTNGLADAFVRDLVQNTTTRVSISTSGQQTFGPTSEVALSTDGRYVAFSSKGSNLAAGDTNGLIDVFVRDRQVNTTTRVSVDSGANQGLGESGGTGIAISGDGQVVAFTSRAPNFACGGVPGRLEIYARRMATNTTALVSAAADGTVADGDCTRPSLSANGSQIAFDGVATNLVTGDTNGVSDVFAFSCGSPAVTSQPASQIVCEGGTVMLAIETNGAPTNSFQWRKGGIPIAGANCPTLTLDPVALTDAGIYTVQAISACGAVTSNAATLTVRSTPIVTSQPASLAVSAGQSASFSVTASSDETPTFQWQRGTNNLNNGGNVSGATTATLTLNPVGQGDADADYHCVVSNSCGSSTSETATLTVNGACIGATVVTGPVTQSACSGTSLQLSVIAGGTPPLTFQWFKNNNPINGATVATLTINPVTGNSAGSYTVSVNNTCGNQTSAAAVLSVNSGPVVTSQPSNRTACAGGSTTLAVTAAGTATLHYQWRRAGVDIPTATQSTYTISPVSEADAASYSVVVSNTCGGTTSNNATLNVSTGPSILSAPQSQTGCTGTSVTFHVTADGPAPLHYQWRRNNVDIQNATSSSLTRNGIGAGDAGDYSVRVSNDCGAVVSTSATLTVGALPAITSQPAGQSGCAGDSATLAIQATGNAPTYQWRKGSNNLADDAHLTGATAATLTINPMQGSDSATNYNCVVTDSCGTATSGNAIVRVNTPVIIDTQPGPQTAPLGGAASFNVTAHGSATLTYQWRKNGTNISGATNASRIINPVKSDDAGSYDCVLSNPCGSLTSNAVALTVTGATGPTGSTGPTGPGIGGNGACGACGTGASMASTGTVIGLLLSRRRRGARGGGRRD